MKSVLLVDDEANVLEGLQRMLRSMRREWRVEVASSGPAALALLEAQPFDIVVSDMKMPGMDGAELLARVKQLQPASIRIVLSGQAERTAILKSVAPSHRYLSKPCDAQTLKRTIERTHALGALLGADEIKPLVSSVDFLPGATVTFRQLRDEFARSAPSMSRIVNIVGRDPGMGASVLKLVNSAYFGMREPTAAVERALSYLGPESLRDLWSVPIFVEYAGFEGPDFSAERLGQEGLRVAAMARIVAETVGGPGPAADEAYQAGMLHGVGRLVLASGIPERYGRVVDRAARGTPLGDAERDEIGATHAEVGAYLLGLWGLPEPIVEAVAYQSRPAECPTRDSVLVTAVHVASGLSAASSPRLDHEFLCGQKLEQHIPYWREAWLRHEALAGSRA